MTAYIFILVGLAITLICIFKTTKNKELMQTGQKTEGIIFDQDVQSNYIGGSSDTGNINNNVTVRFVTEKKEWITKEINQEFGLFFIGQYKSGEKITIFYDKDDPNTFYVDSKQSETIVRALLIVVGLILLGIGLYQILVSGS